MDAVGPVSVLREQFLTNLSEEQKNKILLAYFDAKIGSGPAIKWSPTSSDEIRQLISKGE